MPRRRDVLTRGARILAQSRVASPVIVKTKKGRLRDVFETVRPYVEQISSLMDRSEIRRIFPRVQRAFTPDVTPFTSALRTIPRFNMLSGFLPREIIFAMADGRYVDKIYPDTPMHASFATVPDEGVFTAPHRITKEIKFTTTLWTKQLIGADVANQKGFRGSGIKTAIADTGASRVHEQIRGVQFASAMPQVRDDNGHGTWCTTCVGGVRSVDEYLSRRSGATVECEGMAPECDLLAIKCLGFIIGIGSTSNIIEAISMSMDNEASIISMSLGGPAEATKAADDPYSEIMDKVLDAGVIPIVAAGNSGPEKGSIDSPGHLPQVLTVGAWDPIIGKIAEFSGRGPAKWGHTKPDVIAPGVNIDSGICAMLDTSGDGFPSRYSPISGTSMATPHVAGLVTLMCEAHRGVVGSDLTVDEIKDMMKALGRDKTNTYGWGPITWDIYEKWISSEYGVEI